MPQCECGASDQAERLQLEALSAEVGDAAARAEATAIVHDVLEHLRPDRSLLRLEGCALRSGDGRVRAVLAAVVWVCVCACVCACAFCMFPPHARLPSDCAGGPESRRIARNTERTLTPRPLAPPFLAV